MRTLITAAFGLISRRRLAVALAVLALQLPSQLLELSRTTATLGAVVGWAALVLLLLVFLSDGRGRPYPVVRTLVALLRAFGSLLIIVLIATVLLLLMAFVGTWLVVVLANAIAMTGPQVQQAQFVMLILCAVLLVALISPLWLLLLPVCLEERGGPWAAVKRSWRLSRSRWRLAWLASVASLSLIVPAALFHSLGGIGPVALSMALSTVAFVLGAALGVALYRSLVAQSAAATTAVGLLLVPRSREVAAAGTFRASGHQGRRSRRRQR
jgi:hypothetical protein